MKTKKQLLEQFYKAQLEKNTVARELADKHGLFWTDKLGFVTIPMDDDLPDAMEVDAFMNYSEKK